MDRDLKNAILRQAQVGAMDRIKVVYSPKSLKVREAATKLKLSPSVRTRLNKDLDTILKGYHPHIPWDAIEDVLSKQGVVPLQEDNTKWEGFFTGAQGKASIDLAPKDSGKPQHGLTVYEPYGNAMLILNWYKMDSGRYEVVSYVS